jgi:hypothetical protein
LETELKFYSSSSSLARLEVSFLCIGLCKDTHITVILLSLYLNVTDNEKRPLFIEQISHKKRSSVIGWVKLKTPLVQLCVAATL